ncbi:MAG: FtsH protease activity modulator HflK [Akkermansiaceae bacterium]|nr:FtsH protease activity modulator HflK [Akkermansiaceae bacterium]
MRPPPPHNTPSSGPFRDVPPGWRFQLRFAKLLLIPLVLFVAAGAFSAYYTVRPESVAVIQRFGRYQGTYDPGLHFKLPWGIDRMTIVPVKRQLKLEFGFGTKGATNDHQGSMEPELERDMVSGDLNAAEVEWVVQYGISVPREFLFNVRNPEETLRDVSEAVMCEVIGDRTVDEILTFGRAEIEVDTLKRMKNLMESYHMGIRVEQIQLINVHPPRPVQQSFDEVNRAKQEREELINQANGAYNQVIPKAKGLAAQRISRAKGTAIQRVNQAEGDVARFRELLAQYEKAPAITRQRLYLETMGELLPKMGPKIILDEDAKQFLPLMNLNSSGTPAR